ncbi:hypothetical protein SDC9_199155 [bioreactor metagenome]|uniref:Uncharacterized protein n=1 Tax=bioreactor metagenome TaxID=1076179 RepID=A0A645IJQ0_9ZZZZ
MERPLERFVRHNVDREAAAVHRADHVRHVDHMVVVRVEHGESAAHPGQLQNRRGGGINGRKLDRRVHPAHRERAERAVAAELAHEAVGQEVDLELAVACAAHQVSDAHDAGVQAIRNSRQNGPFGKKF